jgi:subtilase family serine protease
MAVLGKEPQHMTDAARTRRSRLIATAVLPTAAAVIAGTFVATGTASAAVSRTAGIAGGQPTWATRAADRGATPAGDTLTAQVYLAGQDPAGLAAYARSVSDPNSPDYHRYLTPGQALARYGSTPAQQQAVAGWLRSAGLHVTDVTAHAVTFTGTVSAASAAFGTGFHQYAVAGGDYRAPDAAVTVPTAVAGDILGVDGLAELPHRYHTDAVAGPGSSPASKAAGTLGTEPNGVPYLGTLPCSSYYGQKTPTGQPKAFGRENPWAPCGYLPTQIRGAYGVTSSRLTGHGVTVAIVDAYASPTMLADVNEYSRLHGVTPFAKGQYTEYVTKKQWRDENQCQGTAGWAGEESLDVEAVHSMAPGATVRYFGANSCNDPDMLAVFTNIIDHRLADMVSNSWGGPLYSTQGNEPTGAINEYDTLLKQAAVEGIGFYFAAGDCGADAPNTGCGNAMGSPYAQAEFPDSDPWVTAVGGTAVAIDGRGHVDWTVGWGNNGYVDQKRAWVSKGYQGGGGGGTSQVFAQPFYQPRVVPTALAERLPDGKTVKQPMRVTPDVAMDADPITGLLVGQTQPLGNGRTAYAESPVGGTSLACPLFVGLQADAQQAQHGVPIGFANPLLYDRYGTSVYTDVTSSRTTYADVFNTSSGVNMWSLGQTGILQATRGYDDVSGVGTPSAGYLEFYKSR